MKKRSGIPLTKLGTPRKRAPGGGRRPSGRTAQLSTRIKPEAKQQLDDYAAANDVSLAEAVEEGAKRLAPGGPDAREEEPCIIIISGRKRKSP